MDAFYTANLIHLSPEFDACYSLIQDSFPPDEVVDRAEYAALLTRPHRKDHPHWFTMLTRWSDRGPLATLIGVLAGSYIALNASQSIGMVEYLAIDPTHQQEGHGQALLETFERYLRTFAQQRSETLEWIVGEVDDDLLPFKFHLGYGLPEGLTYFQPPIEFDHAGEPRYNPVKKHLVMKPMNGQAMMIEPTLLREVVQAIYAWRYVPLLGHDAMRQLAADYIEHEVYRHVAASIPNEPLVLNQVMTQA